MIGVNVCRCPLTRYHICCVVYVFDLGRQVCTARDISIYGHSDRVVKDGYCRALEIHDTMCDHRPRSQLVTGHHWEEGGLQKQVCDFRHSNTAPYGPRNALQHINHVQELPR